MNLNPQILTNLNRLQEIYDLRILSYENSNRAEYVNRNRFPNGWKDNLDERPDTLHWIVEESGMIVASTRLVILNDPKDTLEDLTGIILPPERPFAYWSRLVVHPNYRNLGIANLLDGVVKEWLINHPEVKFAVCCASSEREGSILKQGFKYICDYLYNWVGISANHGLSVHPLIQKVFILTNGN